MYEIVMPQLSDSMDEGKLVAWKVHEGEDVHVGDVIAEVESDKAIMEVQSFKAGVVKELLVKEGESVPVGTVIARIETNATTEKPTLKQQQEAPKPKKEEPEHKAQKNETKSPKKETLKEKHPQTTPPPKPKPHSIQNAQGISPKARALAAKYGIEASALLAHFASDTLHAEDVVSYLKEHYFTQKAQKLLDEYALDIDAFSLDHKIDSAEVQKYIEAHNLPKALPLDAMHKAIIATVAAAAQKPVYHIYESLDASEMLANEHYSITAWLIKHIAKAMMAHEEFRSSIKDDRLLVAPHASISVAVAQKGRLYMPVVKNAESKNIREIAAELESFKTKLKTNSFTAADLQGSSFGISNLGMLGIERFDAMINKNDTAIVAVGAVNEQNKISITFTIDHRLVNGYEAALFVQTLKQIVTDPKEYENV